MNKVLRDNLTRFWIFFYNFIQLGVEEVQLRSLTWKRLLDPEKKGQWWICGGDSECQEGSHSEVVDFVHKESLEAEKLLQLAASQRMNTDIRRAIFCVVMSGEDYLDAFEKILRIKLSGKQVFFVLFPSLTCKFYIFIHVGWFHNMFFLFLFSNSFTRNNLFFPTM